MDFIYAIGGILSLGIFAAILGFDLRSLFGAGLDIETCPPDSDDPTLVAGRCRKTVAELNGENTATDSMRF